MRLTRCTVSGAWYSAPPCSLKPHGVPGESRRSTTSNSWYCGPTMPPATRRQGEIARSRRPTDLPGVKTRSSKKPARRTRPLWYASYPVCPVKTPPLLRVETALPHTVHCLCWTPGRLLKTLKSHLPGGR